MLQYIEVLIFPLKLNNGLDSVNIKLPYSCRLFFQFRPNVSGCVLIDDVAKHLVKRHQREVQNLRLNKGFLKQTLLNYLELELIQRVNKVSRLQLKHLLKCRVDHIVTCLQHVQILVRLHDIEQVSKQSSTIIRV